jgi:GNAT superfamily N-acetyltransferase
MNRKGRTANRRKGIGASARSPPAPELIRLRRTTLDDLPTLVVHRRRMWEDIGGRTRGELDRADPVYRRWVRREIAAGRFVGFLVENRAGRPLGSGAIWLTPSQPRPGRLAGPTMPYILSMFTEPAARGRGVASRIVHAMIAWATRRGFRRIFLHASEQGRSVYERLGFVPGNEMRLELPARRKKAG